MCALWKIFMALIVFLAGIILFVPDYAWHRVTVSASGRPGKVLTWTAAVVVTLVLILPMQLSPIWNGAIREHRNQYELMAESLLEGHLYIDYQDIDPKLLEMENPYDPEARKQAKVDFHWDHAWYNGHYYMYFGIVPVLSVFLPFRVIAGRELNTMRATQLFTGLGVIGLFALFRMLSRRFFPKMTLGTCLVLSISVSFISFWYASGFPALYCTAISSGVCLEIWSLVFFFKGVFIEPRERLQLVYAALGGFCGALVLGCRPTIALANLLILPLLAAYLAKKKREGTLSLKLIFRIFLAALPGLIVVAGLLVYNAVRFDSPFEFGQSYQLTVADQHHYGGIPDLTAVLNGMIEMFFQPMEFQTTYPWLSYGGIYSSFPLLLFGIALLLPGTLRSAGREKAAAVLIGCFLLPLLITLFEVLWSPYLLERYQMDIYYLMGIGAFFSIGFIGERMAGKKHAAAFRGVVSFLAMAAVISAVLLWVVPHDKNYTAYVEGALEKTGQLLFFLKP